MKAEQPSCSTTGTGATGKSSDSPFKVGNKVLIYEKDEGCNFWATVSGQDKTIGKTGVIFNINGDGDCQIRFDDGESWWFPARSLRHADYKPEAGDVVEFEFKGKTGRGLIFYYIDEMSISTDVENDDFRQKILSWHDDYKNMRKIGVCDEIKDVTGIEKGNDLAKAYFSEQSEPKSYVDQSRAWVKLHNIKKGSKVKVLRCFDSHERGSAAQWCEFKAGVIGKECVVLMVDKDDDIKVRVDNRDTWFPYFVLEPVK